jgi:hypothetical protein
MLNNSEFMRNKSAQTKKNETLLLILNNSLVG